MAYFGVRQIEFDKMFYRKDISDKALRRPYQPMKAEKAWIALAVMAVVCAVWVQPFFNQVCSMKYTIAKAAISLYLLIRCALLINKKRFSMRICIGSFVILAIMAMMVSMFAKKELQNNAKPQDNTEAVQVENK